MGLMSEEPYISPSSASSTESIARLPSESTLSDCSESQPTLTEENSPKAQDVERLRFRLRQAAACFDHNLAAKLVYRGRDKTEVFNELIQIPGFTWIGRISRIGHHMSQIHCEVIGSKIFLSPSQVKHGKPWCRLEKGDPVLFEIGPQPRFPERIEAKNVEHFSDGSILFERLP